MKKELILGPEEKKCLSFDEVFDRFQNLARKHAWRWEKVYSYDIDDMIQIAYIGLWKAYNLYDLKKVESSSFGVYASVIIWQELQRYHKSNKGKFENKTSKVECIMSLNALDEENKNKDFIELLGLNNIGFKNDIDQLADKEVLKEILKELTDKEREYVDLFSLGWRKSDIARKYNRTRQSVTVELNRIFERLRNTYEKEINYGMVN